MRPRTIIFYCLTDTERGYASALKPEFETLGLTVKFIFPNTYSEADTRYAAEFLESEPEPVLILFQTSFLTIVKTYGHAFPFYERPYPVVVLFEEELLGNLFYLKDYKKNVVFGSVHPRSVPIYHQLGFSNVTALPPFCMELARDSVGPDLNGLGLIGRIFDPEHILQESFTYIKTPEVRDLVKTWDSYLQERNYQADSFIPDFVASLSKQTFGDPSTFAFYRIFSALSMYLQHRKLALYIGSITQTVWHFGKCTNTTLSPPQGPLSPVSSVNPNWAKLIISSPLWVNPMAVFKEIQYFKTVIPDQMVKDSFISDLPSEAVVKSPEEFGAQISSVSDRIPMREQVRHRLFLLYPAKNTALAIVDLVSESLS